MTDHGKAPRSELRIVAALGREFDRLAERERAGQRISFHRHGRRTLALAAIGLLLLSAGAGAATGVLPIGSVIPGRSGLPRESKHIVVARGDTPVAGEWRMDYYTSGRLTHPETGEVLQPAGLRSLGLELMDPSSGEALLATGNCGSRRSPGFNVGARPAWDETTRRAELLVYGCAPERATAVELRTVGGLRVVEPVHDGPAEVESDFWLMALSAEDTNEDGKITARAWWVDDEAGVTGPKRWVKSPRRGWFSYFRTPTRAPRAHPPSSERRR